MPHARKKVMPHARKQHTTPRRIAVLRCLIGGLDIAVHNTLGAQPAWFVENDPAASTVLETHWPDVPNHGDITTIDWKTLQPVDILTGGFPCQDISGAGRRRGLTGTRSGLWVHMATAIDQLRPGLVLIENVRGLLSAKATHPAHTTALEPCPWCVGNTGTPRLRALGAVLGDLADLRYNTRWVGLPASGVGAAHPRYRIFLAATTHPHSPNSSQRWTPTPQQTQSRRTRTHIGRRSDTPTPYDLIYLPTPRASDGDKGSPNQHGRRGDLMLAPAVIQLLLPTPTARDAHHGAGWGDQPRRPLGETIIARHDTTRWNHYAPAIHRWENTTGHPAPHPTVTGARGGPKLSPWFTEWLMGFPPGWVTGPLINPNYKPRAYHKALNNALKCLGNAVVPQQAEEAIRHLLGDPR